jgi:protein TonB
MHFSHTNDSGGSKFVKIGIVAALHVAVGIALINNMNSVSISMPKIAEEITVFLPKIEPPPPPPPEPPKPMPKVAPTPKPFVPPVEVDVPQQPQVEQVMETASVPDPAPPVPGPATTEVAPPANPGTGSLRTAVLSDGCATPEYPTRAARNGETGTVTLALLVGENGKVQDSRVQKSSGSRDLDKAAISALSMCSFKPAMAGGTPEAGWAQIAYVWKLDE